MTGTVQSATGDALRIAWDDGTAGPTYRPARDLAAGDRVEVVGGVLRRVEPLAEQTATVLAEVAAERAKQRQKWGNVHDDDHCRGDIAVEAARLLVAGTDAHVEDPLDRGWGLVQKHARDHRRRLIIGIALAVAEVERLDREARRG